MPLYEYYCKHCDGVFETMKPIAKASEPSPCPVCAKKAQRIPPTSFSAFTMREGYPRAIPDRGTYYHLGKEVKTKNTGGVPMNEIAGRILASKSGLTRVIDRMEDAGLVRRERPAARMIAATSCTTAR